MIPYKNHAETRRRLTLGTITLVAVVVSCLAAATARADEAADPAAGGALMLQGKGVAEAMPAVRLGEDWGTVTAGASIGMSAKSRVVVALASEFARSSATSYGVQLGLNTAY